uniref:Homing endonuclease LAGLIDADG domain-containing protein n=1 Tax=Malassezia yamatoensis TaxID=253288 RepID=A0A2I6QD16_9BASI|nr:hypothetical protein [Malassezia yamatoensis]
MNKHTKFHFYNFQIVFSKYYPNIDTPNHKFLEWFIGFSEGNDCFAIKNYLNKDKHCSNFHFIITQSNKNIQTLYFIKNKLGFGKVIKQNKNISQYIIEDKQDICIIINLFNGNIVLPKTLLIYSKWIKFFNHSNNTNFYIKKHIILPQFNDYWISGFTDAQGYCKYSILKNPKFYRYQFIIILKGKENIPILIQIKKVLGGKVLSHSVNNIYKLVINGVNNITNVIKYFDQYQLITSKNKSYYLWKNIGEDILNKKHLISKYNKELKMKSQFFKK